MLPLPPDMLPAPLYETIRSINDTNENLTVDTGSLFWSVGRLFSYYERAMVSLEIPYHERELLDADIESFIIRMRIILNDISFLVRQLLPESARGMPQPKGKTHARNREMSITALYSSLKDQKAEYPEFFEIFDALKPWIEMLCNDRDNLIHYKTLAVVMEDHTGTYFGLRNPAGTHPIDPATGRPVRKKVDDYLNGQLLTLHRLMHDALPPAIRTYAKRVGINVQPYGANERVGGPGIKRFRKANNLHFNALPAPMPAVDTEQPAT